jgi:hypothetical protein
MYQAKRFMQTLSLLVALTGIAGIALSRAEAGTLSTFIVVANGNVTGMYKNLEQAKADLNKYPKGASSPSRMIAEFRDRTVQADPHLVGGQRQGDGLKAGFNKWWRDWNDINSMVKVAQNFIRSKTLFIVVANKQVVGMYNNLLQAKAELNNYPKGAPSPSRMIAEVRSGVVQGDPHVVGGQRQGDGLKAGFNKWWLNWNDQFHD